LENITLIIYSKLKYIAHKGDRLQMPNGILLLKSTKNSTMLGVTKKSQNYNTSATSNTSIGI